MAQKFIDQTTIQPDGKPGDDAFTAFATCNDNFHDAEQRLATLEAVGQDVENLKTGLQQEGDARLLGDDTLGQRIDAEKDARLALGARVIGKNRIINGDFRFWQRGTSFTTSGYGADRFLNNTSGAPCTMSRITLGAGELGGFTTACRMSFGVGSASADYATLQPRLENLAQFSGKTLTFSGYMRASVAGVKVAFEGSMIAGPGGSFPSGMQINGFGVKTFTLGTAWQRFTATFTLPSLVGAVFGPYSSLSFNLWLSAGSAHNPRNNNLGFQSGIVDFTGLQLEDGGIATDFEQRPDALELMLCQRYYRKSYNLDVAPGANSGQGLFVVLLQTLPSASYSSGVQIPLDPPMRDTPAVTVYPKYGGAGGFLTDDASSATRPATVAGVGQTGFYVFASTVSSNQINLQGHWTADAEL